MALWDARIKELVDKAQTDWWILMEGAERQRERDRQTQVATIKGDLRKTERRISDLEAAVFRLERAVTVALEHIDRARGSNAQEKHVGGHGCSACGGCKSCCLC